MRRTKGCSRFGVHTAFKTKKGLKNIGNRGYVVLKWSLRQCNYTFRIYNTLVFNIDEPSIND